MKLNYFNLRGKGQYGKNGSNTVNISVSNARGKMVNDRPETTLFLLVSVDGKISTGDTDIMDVDTDFARIKGIREGLGQYYRLEQKTDLFSLGSGRTMAKIGVNEGKRDATKLPVSFIIVDNKPHLTSSGIDYFLKRSKTFYLVTTNKEHPAFERKDADNLEIIYYEDRIDFPELFTRLKQRYSISRITLQTGGTMSAVLLREKLIDHVSLAIAPVLVGGRNTSSLIEGESLHNVEDLIKIKALTLKKCDVLDNSYLHLQYDVINETIIY